MGENEGPKGPARSPDGPSRDHPGMSDQQRIRDVVIAAEREHLRVRAQNRTCVFDNRFLDRQRIVGTREGRT